MWNLQQYEDNTALYDEYGTQLTYAQLCAFGMQISDRITDRTFVFCLCTNTIGSIAGYVAFMEGGIVPLLINAHTDTELLSGLLALYKPRYLWTPVDMAKEFGGAIVLEGYGYCLVETEAGGAVKLHPELALLLTTSGSTGSPKFVRQSYTNVETNAKQIAGYLELTADERPITTLPMNYTYGLSIINSHLMVGAGILVTDKGMTQREFWDFFDRAEATSFGGVPYTYEMLDRMRFMKRKLPSLRYMTQAGGKLSSELHRKFAEYAFENGKKFIVMYGQCEATARMGYLPAEKSLEKYGSMGVAIPGGEFRLIDIEGKVITEPDTTGELVYRGANVTMGYAQKPEDFGLGDERGGVLETGDMAKRDADGYYYIVGRKKRFLKVYGNRVNLDELDSILKGCFGNIEVACGGRDDHVMVFLVDRSISEKAVCAFLAEKTGLNITAFSVKYIEAIPKNDAGKIQYRELEKYYEL